MFRSLNVVCYEISIRYDRVLTYFLCRNFLFNSLNLGQYGIREYVRFTLLLTKNNSINKSKSTGKGQ